MKSKTSVEKGRVNPDDKLEMLYRGILENALDCIITIDFHGRIIEFNPAAERVFGFSRDEALGKELAELIIPQRMREQHRRGLARYLKTGEGPVIGRRMEIAGLRKDGTEILVELAITAIKIDSAPLLPICAISPNANAMRKPVVTWARSLPFSDDAVVTKDCLSRHNV